MHKLGYPVSFFGADPIAYINSDIYSQIGSFFPFAVGGKSGISNARVMEKCTCSLENALFSKFELQTATLKKTRLTLKFPTI